MERFEEMCRIYINGSDEVKALILSYFDTEEEKNKFLEGVGYYKLFTNQSFYNAVRDALAEQIWNEANK